MNVATIARDRVRSLLVEGVLDNPVVTRELRTRMRGWKAFTVMGAYVLFVAGIQFIAYVSIWSSYVSGHLSLVDRNVGMDLFRWLAWTQAVLLTLIIPSLTFSSLTQEIERKTMEMLALTRLSPGKTVVGKQLAGFLYALILLICTVPLASMCLMLGGISPAEIGLWYFVLAAWCFLLTCVGVFWSSLFSRTAAAALFTYGTAVFYFLNTIPLGFLTVNPFFGSSSNPHVLGALNPGWASFTSLMVASVCGVKVPLWLSAVGLHVWTGVLLLLIASTHVKYKAADRALPVRIMLIGLTAGLIWLLVGNLEAMGGAPSSQQYTLNRISTVAGMLLGFVSILICSVATGEVKRKPGQSVVSYALSVRNAFKGDLGGAVTFVFLWMALSYAAFAGTLAWLMKSQPAGLSPAVWRSLSEVGVSLVAMAVGIAAVGVLSSCCVKQRRNAGAMVLLFLILVYSGYGIVLAYYVPGQTVTSGPVWQLAAFWPLTPIMSSTNAWRNMPTLWWSAQNSWIVTSVVYLAIALASLALGSRAVSRYGGVREE